MSDKPTLVPVDDIKTAILGAPPARMSANEIEWTRRSALRDVVDYHNLSDTQQKALHEGLVLHGNSRRCHAKLATESGEPAGSGVCVTSGGRRGMLTARHVLYADDEGKVRLPNPVIGFMPTQSEMLRELRRCGKPLDSNELLAVFPTVGVSLGDRETVVPLHRHSRTYPDPGLPDIAIIAISDAADFEGRLREAAAEHGTITPEPEWLDLDTEEQVGIPYSITDANADEMLKGFWTINGVRGERSSNKKIYSETDIVVLDRIYRRNEYEYYGVFLDRVNGSRTRGWKGTSGGGVWQQRLTRSGQQKIKQFSPPPLTPEDLEPPVLGGMVFYHETRKSAQELTASDGTCYRSELYAHRIDEMLLGIIRRAVRHGVKMVGKTEQRNDNL